MEAFDFNDIQNANLNILPYGAPGVGKTRFVSSVGEKLYTLGVDVDNGFVTFKKSPSEWTDNIFPIRMTDFRDIDAIYKLLNGNDPEKMTVAFNPKGMAKDDPKYRVVREPFRAVAFDTWSETNWHIVEKKREDVKKQGTGLLFRENIQIQDWGAILDLNRLCIQAFREMPITFICSMHQMWYTDAKSAVVEGVPSVSGKFAPEIGKHFDIVGHMKVNNSGQYVMTTKPTQRMQGKSRLDLATEIVDPTFGKIWDALCK